MGIELQVHYQWTRSYSIDRAGNYSPHVALAVVNKILKMAQKQSKKNPLKILKLVNPRNGHEYTWTPRGWVETRLPKLDAKQIDEVKEDIQKVRRAFEQAINGTLKQSRTGLTKDGNVVIQLKKPIEHIEVSIEIPARKK